MHAAAVKAPFTRHGVRFLAEGEYYPGFRGSQFEPAEPAGWEITHIAFADQPLVNFVDWCDEGLFEAAREALDAATGASE